MTFWPGDTSCNCRIKVGVEKLQFFVFQIEKVDKGLESLIESRRK